MTNMEDLQAVNKRLKEEIERLKGLLERIRNSPKTPWEIAAIADEALEGGAG